MASNEGITQRGVGVEYKKVVSTRKDRVSGHGDMKMSGTKEAFNKACKDTKKA
jgi:hypothetical protein